MIWLSFSWSCPSQIVKLWHSLFYLYYSSLLQEALLNQDQPKQQKSSLIIHRQWKKDQNFQRTLMTTAQLLWTTWFTSLEVITLKAKFWPLTLGHQTWLTRVNSTMDAIVMLAHKLLDQIRRSSSVEDMMAMYGRQLKSTTLQMILGKMVSKNSFFLIFGKMILTLIQVKIKIEIFSNICCNEMIWKSRFL